MQQSSILLDYAGKSASSMNNILAVKHLHCKQFHFIVKELCRREKSPSDGLRTKHGKDFLQKGREHIIRHTNETEKQHGEQSHSIYEEPETGHPPEHICPASQRAWTNCKVHSEKVL